MLKSGGTYGEGDEALEYYAKHTAQIEVCTSVLFLAAILDLLSSDSSAPERHRGSSVI